MDFLVPDFLRIQGQVAGHYWRWYIKDQVFRLVATRLICARCDLIFFGYCFRSTLHWLFNSRKFSAIEQEQSRGYRATMVDWTDEELRSAVDAYMILLAADENGTATSKTAVREQLLAGGLSARSAGSYEYRMQNISAVLEEMGLPWVQGYKPASNVGPTVTQKLAKLIRERTGHGAPKGSSTTVQRVKPRYVYVANFGQENFEWRNCLAGSYVATMQDPQSHEYWLAGDREGYINFAMSSLRTAKGLPPIRPVASRWYNLATIVAETEGDLWFHRQGGMLWWTVTTSEPVRLELGTDPSARPTDDANAIFYRKPSLPWSDKTLAGNRLDWPLLHPKCHDFFSTEATLQKLGPEYAAFAVALINGDDLREWTDSPTWKAKVAARGGNSGGTVLNARQRTIATMATRAMQTARGANGQKELRRVKNKEFRFASQREFEAYIANLWDSQEGLCALSGQVLQCQPAEDADFCASLDRKDSDGHYEPGNLHIVCWFINRWKSDDSLENFARLLKVVQNRTDEELTSEV